MPQHYDPEFKKQIVRLHLEEGRTIISLQKEYTVSKAAISKWVKQFRDECQDNPKAQSDYNYMKENLPITTQKSRNLISAILLTTNIYVPENVPKVERRIG